MKKFQCLLIIIILVFCQGCAGSLLNKLPNKSFKTLNYNRVILGCTGHIDAKNGQIKNGVLTVEDLHIKELTPWGQIEIDLTGYSKVVSDDENDL